MDKKELVLGVQQGKRRTHTVEIDLSHIDPEYVGTFKFHHPSLMEKVEIGTIKAQLLKGLPQGSIDVIADNIAHMAATLQVVLDVYPKWFTLDLTQMYDYEVLDAVYEEYAQWYESFRKTNSKSDAQRASKTS